METESESIPTAVFMAFGTQGDVYPIAAIAAAFACDQKQYRVFLITHSAHEKLSAHLVKKNVAYLPVTSPPVLSPREEHGSEGSPELSFSLKKRHVSKEHRRECLSIVENIFQHGAHTESDFIAINFFALEGWSLAELFHVRCIVTAPYVVPYSAPSSFERCFKKELPSLHEYLQEAPADKVSWKDIVHWMWPLFTQDWGLWRSAELNLSACPFMDPVTGVPAWHDRYPSPLLLYGFSTEIVECPDYWPPNVRVCGFWFLPIQWQFSCDRCREVSALKPSAERSYTKNNICLRHTKLQSLLSSSLPTAPIFIGLSSVGRMGFLRNPLLFVRVLQSVLGTTSYNFILFTAGYEPLNTVVQVIAAEESFSSERSQCSEDEVSIFGGRLVCFSGTMPYHWLFPRCAAAIHHGGSGSTAAALHAGIPQVICPFMLDQFYWAERMSWLGVAPEPLKRSHLLPETNDNLAIGEAVNALSKAINYALTPEVKTRALEISKTISLEDGIFEAVKILKQEVCWPKSVDL